ncbi:MAG: 2'-5' RNA ligase family protein [Panacagrimonas sp.]
MKRPRKTAFWLIPGEPHHSRFSAQIAQLAVAYDTPVFEPHITLHVAETTPEDDLPALLQSVACAVAPFAMSAGASGHSRERFKTLFVEFDDPRPVAIQNLLRNGLRGASSYVLAPHLSLLYREALDEPVRRVLASGHGYRGRLVRFERLAAVFPGGGREDFDDVLAWDTALQVRLGD